MQTMIDRIQKLVTFSPQLYGRADKKAKQLGVPFAEYIRHLIIKDVEADITDYPMVDPDTERQIGESLKALEEGRYVDIDPSNEEEFNKFLGIKK